MPLSSLTDTATNLAIRVVWGLNKLVHQGHQSSAWHTAKAHQPLALIVVVIYPALLASALYHELDLLPVPVIWVFCPHSKFMNF